MENKQKIIEKIGKLLNYKNGATASEVETALSLAFSLATKHNIDINMIDPSEGENSITEETIPSPRKYDEVKYASLICKHFFSIEPILAPEGVVFVGTKSDIQIAIYVYTFLVGHFRAQWKIMKKKYRLSKRESFMCGMYDGLYRKLYRQQWKIHDECGIVLSRSKLNEYMKKYQRMTTAVNVQIANDNSTARRVGVYAGAATNINKGLNGDSSASTKQLNQ